MPVIHLGRKNEPATILEESPDLLVVRTRDRLPLLRFKGNMAIPLPMRLDRSQLVISFPTAGVEVYRISQEGERGIEAIKRDLHERPDVRFAGRVLVDPDTKEPVIYTENIFVKFTDASEPSQCEVLLREHGLRIKKRVTYTTNAYFTAATEGTGQEVFAIADRLLQRDDVEYCHPELIRKRALKAIPIQQWHLLRTTLNGIVIDAHANVEAAHDITRGEGVTIAIIDDGVDIDHLEFSGNGKVVAPHDMTMQTDDPRPKDTQGTGPRNGDNHGTACAGVACASGSGAAVGVAPNARLMPIRLELDLGSMQEAEAFEWAADHGADVISCSWGPTDGDWSNPNDPAHRSRKDLPAQTKLAIDHAIEKGRGGKGCVILFAAGNGNESVEYDGYASYEKVIAVAACNDQGKRSVYSDYGKAVWCSFPSSDFGWEPFGQPEPLTTGIWTTDRVGKKGYNTGSVDRGDVKGDYTNSFGGTSSSCPGAAGVAALILSVNPGLRSHEVKDILARACDKIDSAGGAYDANGHSTKYGYGRLNALTAVRLAQGEQS